MAIIIFGKTASGKSRIVDELVKRGFKKNLLPPQHDRQEKVKLMELITSLLPLMNLKSLLIQDILQSGRNITQ